MFTFGHINTKVKENNNSNHRQLKVPRPPQNVTLENPIKGSYSYKNYHK